MFSSKKNQVVDFTWLLPSHRNYRKPKSALMPKVDATLLKAECTMATHHCDRPVQSLLPDSTLSWFPEVMWLRNPFCGKLIYVCSTMALPRSEIALEEIIWRVLSNLLKEGKVFWLANDLYCGDNTVSQLLDYWKRVLHALHSTGLCLSASEPVIHPRSTMVLRLYSE